MLHVLQNPSEKYNAKIVVWPNDLTTILSGGSSPPRSYKKLVSMPYYTYDIEQYDDDKVNTGCGDTGDHTGILIDDLGCACDDGGVSHGFVSSENL